MLPPRVTVLGSDTSRSGLRVVTAIEHRSQDGEQWPYLTVEILDPGGVSVYRSHGYAAWFDVNLCWGEADRLWIASADTGVDVVVFSDANWRRHRWMQAPAMSTLIDARSGERIDVVDWDPPAALSQVLRL